MTARAFWKRATSTLQAVTARRDRDSLAPSRSPSPGSGRSGQKPELLQGSLAGHGEYLGEERRAEHPKQRDELSVSVRQKQMHRLRKQTVLGAVIRPSVVSDSWQPHGL